MCCKEGNPLQQVSRCGLGGGEGSVVIFIIFYYFSRRLVQTNVWSFWSSQSASIYPALAVKHSMANKCQMLLPPNSVPTLSSSERAGVGLGKITKIGVLKSLILFKIINVMAMSWWFTKKLAHRVNAHAKSHQDEEAVDLFVSVLGRWNIMIYMDLEPAPRRPICTHLNQTIRINCSNGQLA